MSEKTGERERIRFVKDPVLDENLHVKLVERSLEGDFRAPTAVSCGIHPTTLDTWLTRGATNLDDEPYTSFAMDFLGAEADLRRMNLSELLLCKDKTRAQVLMWYIPRRFRDWNESGNVHGREALDILEAIGRGGLTQEQRFEVVSKLLDDPTPELVAALEQSGWTRKGKP